MTNESERELPGPVMAELTRLRAEREVFAQQQEQLKVQLREAQIEATELAKHRDELLTQISEHSDLLARAERSDALAHDVAVARAERDTLRAELADGRTERDRLRIQLLEAETVLATTDPTGRLCDHERKQRSDDTEVADLTQRADQLARELAATHHTVSWRVTAPLRALRRRAGRR